MSKLDSSDPPRKAPEQVAGPRPTSFGGLLLRALRRNWRSLRTMRTALWLLGVVGVETVVATVVPQEPNVPNTVAAWRTGAEGPGAGVSGVLDALGAYDVYTSPIFLATLLLLFTSLTACLLPRIRGWWRIVRHSQPPLSRHVGDQEHVERFASALTPEQAHAAARGVLSDHGYRVRDGDGSELGGAGTQVAAEKGLAVREGGSLAFHLSFYVLLAAIVFGQFLTFEGAVGVVEGEGVADTVVAYGRYRPGRWFGPEDHTGFELELDDFRVDWVRDPDAPGAGTPTLFEADLTITEPDGGVRTDTVRSNQPVVVDGRKIHLLGWGYAVKMRIVQGGDVAYESWVPLVFDDDQFVYAGVARAPGADPDLGLDLKLVPFAPDGDDGRPRLTGAPWAEAPALFYDVYVGDLQLSADQDAGALDTDAMQPLSAGYLRPGDAALAGGPFLLEFVEIAQWANMQVSYRPQVPALLLGAALMMIGLMPALYAYRRRVWVAVRPANGPEGGDGGARTLVTVAGRTFQRAEAFEEEFDALQQQLRGALEATDTVAPTTGTAP